MSRYILAHDLGTTGNKATIYDADGMLQGTAFFAYETQYPQTGWAEQDPSDWWKAICTTTQQLLHQTGIIGSAIACVTFSGQMQGIVPVDVNGKPLRSAIIWMDQRATTQADALAEKISPDEVYQITGHRLSPAYTLHKIRWIREHQPEIFKATHKFLCAKDAMVARMTGAFVTEPSDASGTNAYDLQAGVWSQSILDAAELDVALLPEVKSSVDVAGTLTKAAAIAVGLPTGTPVVIGGGDGACASVGAGSVVPGAAYSYVGSSAWVATASTEPIFDPLKRTFTFGHVVPGLYIPMGTMQTAGTAYQWMRDQLSPLEKQSAEALGISPYTLMNAIAEGAPAGANGLVFLPYLAGERAPRWNPNARAAFIGLTVRHTRADMLRAVMEGVAFNLNVVLEAFRQQGEAFDAIRAIGGGVSGRLWASIMADVYNVPLHRLHIPEQATSMGAAVTGGVGVGLYDGFDIAQQMNTIADTIQPKSVHRAAYDRAYRIFDASYAALEPIYHMLAQQEGDEA